MIAKSKRKIVWRKALTAYVAACALPMFILAVSLVKGAGWRPVLVGLPAYLTFFAAITYQLVKELRALERDVESNS
ncbi:hypothetical protein AB4Y45_02160 [Paraburkholderia sp. EG287A]|uniref:hypothetical protein n=1 Tax=unclassified Paraburkholderia TaxID=2615204 RepID=UPI0034D16A5C